MDLHIAIDEAAGRVLAACEPSPRFLSVAFEIQSGGLSIAVHGDTPLKPGAEFLNPWSKLILESVATDIRVDEKGDAAGVEFAVGRGEPD